MKKKQDRWDRAEMYAAKHVRDYGDEPAEKIAERRLRLACAFYAGAHSESLIQRRAAAKKARKT